MEQRGGDVTDVGGLMRGQWEGACMEISVHAPFQKMPKLCVPFRMEIFRSKNLLDFPPMGVETIEESQEVEMLGNGPTPQTQ